jgi:hypothetical protein
MDPQRPANRFGEDVGQYRKGVTVVCFGIFAVFPEAIDTNFRSAVGEKDELVKEALLLIQRFCRKPRRVLGSELHMFQDYQSFSAGLVPGTSVEDTDKRIDVSRRISRSLINYNPGTFLLTDVAEQEREPSGATDIQAQQIPVNPCDLDPGYGWWQYERTIE